MRPVLKWALVVSAVVSIFLLLGLKFEFGGRQDGTNFRHSWTLEYEFSLYRVFGASEFSINNGSSEDLAASAEHFNIINSIISCVKLDKFSDYYSLPIQLQKQFMLPQRVIQRSSSGTVISTDLSGVSVTKIPGYFRSITELSSLISDRRGQLAASMQSSHLLMQQLQIASIFIGIVTTILVGIKSGAKNARLFDVTAIISAAVGTGIASIIAFYNPREEYIRTARAISQLSQLQTQISFAFGSEKACDPLDQNNSKQLVDWYGYFSQISTASEDFGGSESRKDHGKE